MMPNGPSRYTWCSTIFKVFYLMLYTYIAFSYIVISEIIIKKHVYLNTNIFPWFIAYILQGVFSNFIKTNTMLFSG